MLSTYDLNNLFNYNKKQYPPYRCGKFYVFQLPVGDCLSAERDQIKCSSRDETFKPGQTVLISYGWQTVQYKIQGLSCEQLLYRGKKVSMSQ